jgi:hypothetical protein
MNSGLEPAHLIGIGTSFCCCFLVVAGLGYLAYRLFISKRPPPAAMLTDRPMPSAGVAPVSSRVAQYGNIISNITDDGFYLFNNFLTPGAMIHYRYRGPGGWITRCVPYQPGPQGHYVYVGSQPSDVQIVDVVPKGSPNVNDYEDDIDRTVLNTNAFGTSNSQGMPPSNIQTTTGDYPSAY